MHSGPAVMLKLKLMDEPTIIFALFVLFRLDDMMLFLNISYQTNPDLCLQLLLASTTMVRHFQIGIVGFLVPWKFRLTCFVYLFIYFFTFVVI